MNNHEIELYNSIKNLYLFIYKNGSKVIEISRVLSLLEIINNNIEALLERKNDLEEDVTPHIISRNSSKVTFKKTSKNKAKTMKFKRLFLLS